MNNQAKLLLDLLNSMQYGGRNIEKSDSNLKSISEKRCFKIFKNIAFCQKRTVNSYYFCSLGNFEQTVNILLKTYVRTTTLSRRSFYEIFSIKKMLAVLLSETTLFSSSFAFSFQPRLAAGPFF